MKRSIFFMRQQRRVFTNFFVHHTSSSWQRRLASKFILGSVILFLIIRLLYGVVFMHIRSRYVAENMLRFGGAIVIATVLYVLDRKKVVSFGGVALILLYLVLGAVVAPTSGSSINLSALALFAVATTLAGILYGFWCSLIPASVGTSIFLFFVTDRLQHTIHSTSENHSPTTSSRLFLIVAMLYGCAIVGGSLHSYLLYRYSKRGIGDEVEHAPKGLLLIEHRREVVRNLQLHVGKRYPITVAPTVKALEQFRQGAFQLVMIAFDLLETTDAHLCQEIRKIEEDAPIIVLADRASKRVQGIVLEMGADDYIAWPFDSQQLTAQIDTLLHRNDFSGQRFLSTYDLIIDTEKRQVERAGSTIRLRHKEYSLLEYLIRNKGRVTTKTIILKNIWDKNVQTDSLGVHMKHLRDKIDKPFDVQLLETLHGVGYLIKDLPVETDAHRS